MIQKQVCKLPAEKQSNETEKFLEKYEHLLYFVKMSEHDNIMKNPLSVSWHDSAWIPHLDPSNVRDRKELYSENLYVYVNYR